MTLFDRVFDFGCRMCAGRWARFYAGPVLIALWLAAILAIKVGFYRIGQVTGDLFIYANALANTHWPDRFLYIADYQLRSGTTTLLLDHFEPSSVLLIPLFRLFHSPMVLVVFQGLAPLVLVTCLIVTNKRFGGPAWLGWAVAIFTLFNPLFIDAVIDGPWGFHHDSQFLIYTPLFLTMFLLRRWGWALAFLLLFLGVKEDAAFFGIAFGTGVAACGLPFQKCRREALAVAVISAAWFVLTVVLIPHLVRSPNMYAAAGVSQLGQGIIPLAIEASRHFFTYGWHKLLLYFFYAAGSPLFLVSVLPDIGMYSVMTRASNLYFNFTIITFLAFGVLLTLLRLATTPEGTVLARLRKPLIVAFAVQLTVGVPVGLLEFGHVWGKRAPDSRPVAAADQEAAWRMVDLSCSAAVSSSLLDRFYRLPFYLQWWHVGEAQEVVVVDRALLTARGHDPVLEFVEAHPGRFELIGRSGPVTVWRNRDRGCFPW